MRGPHQHQYAGTDQRIDCNDDNCKKPFVIVKPRNNRARYFQRERIASREVQHARYLDCGPLAWDDR